MRRAILAFLTFAAGPSALAAPGESLADRFRILCDAVQAHHVEAPTRQQMLHAGIIAMYRAVRVPTPDGLSREISERTTYEQFAGLLEMVRPKPRAAAATEAALDRAFLDGVSASVPGGLAIMEAKESKVAAQIAGNRYVGIQISVSLDEKTKRPRVNGVLDGGPAQRAGMKEGDVIEAVDGEPLGGLTLAEYIDRLRGEEGTPVTVAVRRAGEKEPRTFRMVREAMRHATISGPAGPKGFGSGATKPGPSPGAAEPGSFRVAGAGPIGYLKIQEILASTPREVREAAAKMEAEGLKAVVIDLRQMPRGPDSAGGHPAVLLADEFLDSGTIGRLRTASREVTYRAEPGSVFPGWPMAVLVDGGTSDHAEWLAAALKANGRATIVGAATAGLGASRSTIPLGDGGRTASLVTGLLEWPDGRPIGYFTPANRAGLPFGDEPPDSRRPDAGLGVTPDVAVPPARQAGNGAGGRAGDGPLRAAMDVLGKALQEPATARRGGEAKVPAADGRGSG
ncbi:putative CtpA-like serine protease [Aquisphaera giovannonii]|uniref:Putative CtpA-like serine protease n=1 Tax=Aquisphaera giovannonii TaxID=406548 RepID=A0A5B9W357_9BACT|nr:S41 family peptidase [Aquisphaera giovannonii]QEH35022.1 putative CtpA-like serine protease [Aquisphaera giovannonii]